jgi:hypothetical protein
MIAKKVINMTTGAHIPCCWNDCFKDGVELHKFVDTSSPAETITFVFCSERHRGYFINSHRNMGQLPPGMRLSVT